MTICCNLMEQLNTTTKPKSYVKPNQLKDIVKNASPTFFYCKKSILFHFPIKVTKRPPPSQRSTWKSGDITEPTPTQNSVRSHPASGAHQLPSLQSPVPALQYQSPVSRTSSPVPVSSLQFPVSSTSSPRWVRAQSKQGVDTILESRPTRGRPDANQC